MIDDASNIRTGNNPAYTLSNFLLAYPQFGVNEEGATFVPTPVLTMFLNLAHACIKEARWHDMWEFAMGLFIAHFVTLWLQGTADPNSGAAATIAAGQARGVVVSESANDLSVSYDHSTVGNDLDGWAAWKLTVYGQQLATMGKLVGKGGMYVY